MGGLCGLGNWPDFNGWLENTWGAGQEFSVVCGRFYGATNLVFGQNPPYYLDDFRAIYPKFFGLPTALSGCGTTIGEATVTVLSTAGLDYGQFVQSKSAFPKGTVIIDIGDNQVTLNNNALLTTANATLMVFESSPIPPGVILMYLNLAYASLVQARWQEEWFTAMGWFIAHYCTLYARSDASTVFETLQTTIHSETPVGAVPGTAYTLSSIPPGGTLQALTKNGFFQIPNIDYMLNGALITMAAVTTPGDALNATWLVQTQVFEAAALDGAQIAAQGLAGGIQTSKSVGDVSVGYSVLNALEDWGAWNLTVYGQQLATMARVIGSGPMVIWMLLVSFALHHSLHSLLGHAVLSC
jgi:hypothetical protein